MSDTAVTTTPPVASVTLPGGAVITESMTPLERHNAVAASLNLPTAAKPAGIVFGPSGPTPSTVNRLAQGERDAATAAAKAPPPPNEPAKPIAPPQGNPSPQRQADLDRELQAAGIQTRSDGRRIAVGQVDQEAIDLLTASYRTLAAANKDRPDVAARFKAAYENDLKSLLEGRQLSGAQIAEMRKRAGGGNIESYLPKPKEPAQAPAAPTAPGWQSHIEDKEWVSLDKLTVADTSGYTIPQFVKDQRVHVSAFELLQQARTAGITQQQVDAVMRQQAKNAGWVKA